VKKLIYPITVFVVLQLVVLSSLTLWIIWYIFSKNKYEGMAVLAKSTYTSFETGQIGYGVMIGGILLFFVILLGSTYLFVGWIRERLIHRQRATFFSGFTHELMTPLTCIQMNLETLIKHDLDPQKKEQLLLAAFSEGTRLQHTIHNILEMTRLEHKKKTIQLMPYNFSEYLQNFITEVQVKYPTLKISFLGPPNIFTLLDTKAFDLALSNLLENAIKYGNMPEIKLELTIIKDKIHFTFSDNGKEKIINKKKLFKIFYRGNQHIKGSGLGLFITNCIIKLHKGKIKLLEEGPGTTFLITLPLKAHHD